MFLVSAFIFCGLLPSSLAANVSCFSKVDFEFYLLQNLVEEVGLKVKFLKENINVDRNTTCSSLACPNTSCADGWVSYKGSCYFFAQDQPNFFSIAKNYCPQLGASMLHVNDKAENDFIVGQLKHFSKKSWWMGLSDEKTVGDWRWLDTNTTTKFTDWGPGQPDGGVDHCVGYYYPSLKWYDAPCNVKYRFYPICEKRLIQ